MISDSRFQISDFRFQIFVKTYIAEYFLLRKYSVDFRELIKSKQLSGIWNLESEI